MGASGGESEKAPGADNTVIVTPMFDYQCTNKGTFGHDSDCSKFWLCTQPQGATSLEPQLFKCPAGYLYDDEKRRCFPEAEVEECDKVPDLGRFQVEPPAVQLRVSDLEAFFSRFNNF